MSMDDGGAKRFRFSVPAADDTVLAWVNQQSSLSHSIRDLIRRAVAAYGVTDVTCLPVTQAGGLPAAQPVIPDAGYTQPQAQETQQEAPKRRAVAVPGIAPGAPIQGGTLAEAEAQEKSDWGDGAMNAFLASLSHEQRVQFEAASKGQSAGGQAQPAGKKPMRPAVDLTQQF